MPVSALPLFLFLLFSWSSLWGKTTDRLRVDSSGVEGAGIPFSPSISEDGCFVAFVSEASDLVPNDSNGVREIFVRDVQTGQTIRIDGKFFDRWRQQCSLGDISLNRHRQLPTQP